MTSVVTGSDAEVTRRLADNLQAAGCNLQVSQRSATAGVGGHPKINWP